MKLEELVQIIAEGAGIDPLEAGPDGAYAIYIDEFEVGFFADRDGQLWMRGEAASVPDDGAERYLRQVLQWNFGRVRRQHANLSLDPEGRRLWLHQRIAESTLRPDEAVELLEHFVNGLEFWRRQLAESIPAELPRGPLPFLIR